MLKSAGDVLTKLFVLYSIIPLNKWYMTTLWGVGGGLFQAAQDTSRSAKEAKQRAERTATNAAVAGAMGYMGYKDSYNRAFQGDRVTGSAGLNAGTRAGAAALTSGGKTDGIGGIEAYKGNLEPSKAKAFGAGLAGAAMGAMGVNPRVASRLVGDKGEKDYDKRVGTNANQRAVMSREMEIARSNEQNFESKGYNAAPQQVYYKKNKDGTVDKDSITTDASKANDENYLSGTYVPYDNNAAVSSEENQEIIKNHLDRGLESGNHYISAGDVKDANGNVDPSFGNGVLLEDGSRLMDANRVVDAYRQNEGRNADYERGQGLTPESAVSGYAKIDENGSPIADTFTTQRPENMEGYKAVTKTDIDPMLATAGNEAALKSIGSNSTGNSSDGTSLYTVEGMAKASPANAINSYNRSAEHSREYEQNQGLNPDSAVSGFAKVDDRGCPIIDTFITERPENMEGYKAVTRTEINPTVATAANSAALRSIGTNNVGNSSDGTYLYNVEGTGKASATNAVNSYSRVAERQTEMGYVGGSVVRNADGSQKLEINSSFSNEDVAKLSRAGIRTETSDDGKNYAVFSGTEKLANLKDTLERQTRFEEGQTANGIDYSSQRTVYVERDKKTGMMNPNEIYSEPGSDRVAVQAYNATPELAESFDEASKALNNNNMMPGVKLGSMGDQKVVLVDRGGAGRNGGVQGNIFSATAKLQNKVRPRKREKQPH